MALLPGALGFVTSTRPRTAFLPKVSLYQSSVPEEQPSWIELPRRFLEGQSNQHDDAELLLGRMAMVGALGFLVGEILTGESVIEQCVDVLDNLIG